MDFYVLLYLFILILLFICYPKQNTQSNRKMSKEIVRLRRKALSQGGCSLYLDIYKDGVRKYEFLKLYLVPERTRQDKQTNKETLRIAETVKAQRIVEIERDGFNLSKASRETVMDLLERELERKKKEGMMYYSLHYTLIFAREFFGSMMLKDLTRDKMVMYKEYIAQKDLSQNTKHAYFSAFTAAISQGVKYGKVKPEIMSMVGSLPRAETNREFLTMDEVKKLAATDCKDGGLKRAFLFSCLTGLRSIDIARLTWGNVSTVGGFTRLTFVQQKTKGQEYLEISEQAAALMGERGDEGDLVFGDFDKWSTRNKYKLAAWLKKAGINKHITFHCARHTFAVMMLELGGNIAVIQKLLGHRDIDTTLIYAKVLDKTKREAVTMIPRLI